MTTTSGFGFRDTLQLAVVVLIAGALRMGYVHVATDDGRIAPAFEVQGGGLGSAALPGGAANAHDPASSAETLVRNLSEDHGFSGWAPLAKQEETTAHVAPGYYWLVTQLSHLDPVPDSLTRWLQVALGVLSVYFLYFFVRRAFDSGGVALIAGLLAAVHPFWIINVAELNDGVLATFLLTAALMLGTRGSQAGGAFTSLVFGLSLAALAMVRAAMLPFAVLGLLWFLYQCKHARHGWFNAILAFLGFANGLAPWAVRNWREYEEPVPIVSSAYLHAWIGNNPQATGGPLDDAALQRSLAPDRLQSLLDEPNQAKRYAHLGKYAWDEITRDPGAAVARRWQAGIRFITGDVWFREQRMSQGSAPREDATAAAEWLAANLELCLQASLLALVLLALLGWRWSHGWRRSTRLATLALLWLPVPFLLSHAEALSGPRLPWDALLICFGAYALACVFPQVAVSAESDP